MTTGVFIWSFVLFGAIIVAFAAVALVRRRYFGTEDFSRAGFTISDLREMRESGKMSAEEFEKAKAALIGEQVTKGDAPAPSDKLRQ